MTEALSHEQLDLALRQASARITSGFLDFVDLAAQAFTEKLWERFGYVDPDDYFTSRIGVGYRSVRRWMAIHEGLARIPLPERADARLAIAAVGVHKASSLAPVLGLEDQDWRGWIDVAKISSESDLQAQVSIATGAKPRGGVLMPGERFQRMLMNQIPPDCQDEVREIFEVGARLHGTSNWVGVFLRMIQEVGPEWRLQLARTEG